MNTCRAQDQWMAYWKAPGLATKSHLHSKPIALPQPRKMLALQQKTPRGPEMSRYSLPSPCKTVFLLWSTIWSLFANAVQHQRYLVGFAIQNTGKLHWMALPRQQA